MATSAEYVSERIESPGAQASLRRPVEPSEQQLWRMIACIVSMSLLACVVSFLVAGSSWFRHSADPQWIRSSDRIYTAHNIACDILVYGDSTAITGVDPEAVQRITGLKTCNIAQTKGVIVVLGTTGLDIFLQHNPRPRYLVMQFAGADFYHPRNWADTTSYMEGVIPLLRYYPKRNFVAALAQHPEIFMGMMHYAYVSGPLNWWLNRTKYKDWNANTRLVNVHFVQPEPPFTSCSQTRDIDPVFHKPEASFVSGLRSQYAGAADHLLVDVAPLSACDAKFGVIAQALHGPDNALKQYPVTLYNEGYTHYTKQGAERLSEDLANQIEALQKAGSSEQHSVNADQHAETMSGAH